MGTTLVCFSLFPQGSGTGAGAVTLWSSALSLLVLGHMEVEVWELGRNLKTLEERMLKCWSGASVCCRGRLPWRLSLMDAGAGGVGRFCKRKALVFI